MKNNFSPVGENSFDSVIYSSLPTKRESKRFKPVPPDDADEEVNCFYLCWRLSREWRYKRSTCVNSSADNDFGEHDLFIGASQRE